MNKTIPIENEHGSGTMEVEIIPIVAIDQQNLPEIWIASQKDFIRVIKGLAILELTTAEKKVWWYAICNSVVYKHLHGV